MKDTNKEYEKVELLKCNHCMEYHTDTIDNMENHIEQCLMNPKLESCTRCDHMKVLKDINPKTGHPVQGYICTHLDKSLSKQDLLLTGAHCFVKREKPEFNIEKSDRYIAIDKRRAADFKKFATKRLDEFKKQRGGA